MRFLLSLVVLCASMAVSRADQPAGPNSLTAAEIANGWILLFDGKTTFGWNVEGGASVDEGYLVLGGEKSGKAETTCKFGHAILKFGYELPRRWTDEPLDFIFHQHLRPFSQINRPAAPWYSGTAVIDFHRQQDGSVYSKAVFEGTGHWMQTSGYDPAGKGGLDLSGIRFEIAKDHQIRIRNIKLYPYGLTSLFNGKDLTGWHPYQGPDAKSKFSVTPEGTLHIENGKGDLQTDKQWADFLLQIECKTNAPALNSGVFFRCQPNKYQQGYEAQIQNSFLRKPTKEYTIERYDPKTNALIAKDKVKYDSYDYGTGAIYRRIPARFQACKDKEWFTMTINAQGRHMGVWVNGLMVTDWTDNRPLNDNARNGCKLDAGNLSLQGHDPTTNLDFRNIRIVDLAKP